MSKLVRGDQLPSNLRREVLSSYLYRWTSDNPQRDRAWQGINVWVPSFSREGFSAERKRALLSSWQNNRYRERGFQAPPYTYKQRVDDLTDRLAKIERKIAALTF
jgi:hypothetical protein